MNNPQSQNGAPNVTPGTPSTDNTNSGIKTEEVNNARLQDVPTFNARDRAERLERSGINTIIKQMWNSAPWKTTQDQEMLIPATEFSKISGLIETIRTVATSQSDHPPAQVYTELTNNVHALHICFQAHGLDWKSVTPQSYHFDIATFLSSEDHAEHRNASGDAILNMFLMPTSEQAPLLGVMVELMNALDNDEDEDILKAIFVRVNEANLNLRQINEAHDLHPEDHTFPWCAISDSAGEQFSVNSYARRYVKVLQGTGQNILGDSEVNAKILRDIQRRVLNVTPNVLDDMDNDDVFHGLKVTLAIEDAPSFPTEMETQSRPSSMNAQPPIGAQPTLPSMNVVPAPATTNQTDLEGLLCPMEIANMYPEEVTKRTVAWGSYAGGRKYFVNKLGYTGGSTYRRDTESFEECITEGNETFNRWDRSHLKDQDGITYDRYGDKVIGLGKQKKYTKRHLAGIFGVVLDVIKHGSEAAALEALNPDTHEESKRWDVTPILVGWRYDISQPIEKRWETRGCLRERATKQVADKLIYDAAKIQEANYQAGVRRSRSPSAGLIPKQTTAYRNMSLEPGHPVASVEEPERMVFAASTSTSAPSKTGIEARNKAIVAQYLEEYKVTTFSQLPRDARRECGMDLAAQ